MAPLSPGSDFLAPNDGAYERASLALGKSHRFLRGGQASR